MRFVKVSISLPSSTLKSARLAVKKKRATGGNRYGLSTLINELLLKYDHGRKN